MDKPLHPWNAKVERVIPNALSIGTMSGYKRRNRGWHECHG